MRPAVRGITYLTAVGRGLSQGGRTERRTLAVRSRQSNRRGLLERRDIGHTHWFSLDRWRDVAYAGPMAHLDRITIEPGKRSGKPCIRGLRMTVSDALDYLASGMSEDDLLRDFPDLTREDVRACLAFAADRERRLVAVGGG